MAVTPVHHVVAAALLPWNATGVTPWPTRRPCNAAERRGATTAEGSSHAAVGPARPRRAAGAPEHRRRRTLHPRVARWGVLGRAVIRGPHHRTARTQHGQHTGSPGAAWRVPGRDRTRGHKRPD